MIDEAKIIDAYQRGVGIHTIKVIHKIPSGDVRSILSAAGFNVPKPKAQSKYNSAEVERRYKEGATTTQIAEACGINVSTVRSILRERGVKLRRRTSHRYIDLEPYRDKIIERWRRGDTELAIGAEYGVSRGTIIRRLSRWRAESLVNEE